MTAAALVLALILSGCMSGGQTSVQNEMNADRRALGLRTLPTEVVRSLDAALEAAASMGYPVVLKAAGRDRMAKTAAAGFAIDLEGCDALRIAWERMEETLGAALVPALVQPMVGPGVDASVVVRDHPAVGPVVSLGPGGAAAALDTATDLRVLPLSDLGARRLVAASRLAPLLDESGRQALEATLLRVGALAEEVPEIDELVLNPVIVRDGATVVTQARARVAPIERDPRPPIRRI